MTTGISQEFQRQLAANLEAERVHVIAQLADVRRRLTNLKALEAELSARARDLIPIGTIGAQFGDEVVTITQPQSFSPERAAQILKPEVIASISTTIIDPELAKKNLSPAVYDACKVPRGKAQVRLSSHARGER